MDSHKYRIELLRKVYDVLYDHKIIQTWHNEDRLYLVSGINTTDLISVLRQYWDILKESPHKKEIMLYVLGGREVLDFCTEV